MIPIPGSGKSPGEGNGNSLQLPGEFHGQRSLVGYSPWGHKELYTTEQARTPWGLNEPLPPFLGSNVISVLNSTNAMSVFISLILLKCKYLLPRVLLLVTDRNYLHFLIIMQFLWKHLFDTFMIYCQLFVTCFSLVVIGYLKLILYSMSSKWVTNFINIKSKVFFKFLKEY